MGGGGSRRRCTAAKMHKKKLPSFCNAQEALSSLTARPSLSACRRFSLLLTRFCKLAIWDESVVSMRLKAAVKTSGNKECSQEFVVPRSGARYAAICTEGRRRPHPNESHRMRTGAHVTVAGGITRRSYAGPAGGQGHKRENAAEPAGVLQGGYKLETVHSSAAGS